MGVSYVGFIGTKADGAGTTFSFPGAIPVGHLGVMVAVTNFAMVSRADSRGNTWQADGGGGLGVGVACVTILSAYITTAIQAGDTFDFTDPDSSAVFYEFKGVAQNRLVAPAFSNTSFSTTVTPPDSAERLWIGVDHGHHLGSPVAPTVNITAAGWNDLRDASITFASVGIALEAGYQIASGAGSVNVNGSGSGYETAGSRLVSYRPNSGGISIARGPGDQRLVQAVVGPDNALKARLFSSGSSETVSSTVTVDAGPVRTCSLRYSRSATLSLLYSTVAGDVQLRTSRDQGATWSSAVTIASGYQGVAHWLDDRDGMLAVALYDEPNTKWWLAVGTLNDAGDTWSWSTPATLATSAKNAGDIQRRSDGSWEFSYVSTSDVATLIRARSLAADGTGTWA